MQQAFTDKVATVQPGIGRANHPPVEHVGQTHVVHVGQLASGFGGNVYPRRGLTHQPIILHRLERRIAGDTHHMAFACDQFGKAQVTAIAVVDHAVFNLQ